MRAAYLASTATRRGSAKLRRRPPRRAFALLGLNDRHAMQADATRARHDAPKRAHERVDAGGQALPGDRTGTSALRGESRDDGGRAQAAKRDSQLHRRDDVAAGRIDEDDASQPLREGSLSGEIDERLRRALFDHAVGDDHLRTFRAAIRRVESDRAERHRRLFGARRRRACRSRRRRQREQRGDPQRSARRRLEDSLARRGLVGGDGLEPPTLSV